MLIREDPTIDELAGLWEREENEVQLGEFDAIQGYSDIAALKTSRSRHRRAQDIALKTSQDIAALLMV